MVDHEITTMGNFSPTETMTLSHYYNTAFTKLSAKNCTPLIEFGSSSLDDRELSGPEKGDNKCSNDELSNIISEDLLSSSSARYESTAAQKMKSLEKAYKNVMETFLLKMDEFMFSVWKMRDRLIKSLQEFRIISRSTAYIILGSSIANTALVIGSLMRKMFQFSWNPKMFIIPTVTGAVSFTTSLLTLTYMKQTTKEFSNDLRKEIWLLRDLIAVHRKGNWLDDEVAKLFPYGLNINLIGQKALDDTNYFKTKYTWRKYLCSKIILSNIEKDIKLLKNEEFLINVKLFVENPAAEIWWSRLKIKRLLEEAKQKTDKTTVKKFLSYHEDIIYKTTIYIYPALIPWLASSRTSEEMRFICTSLAGILAALELGNDGSEELDKLKRTYQNFERDFKEIYKICEILEGSED